MPRRVGEASSNCALNLTPFDKGRVFVAAPHAPPAHYLSSSTCMRAQNASMTALSKQSPIEPIDTASPASRSRWVNAQDVNWADSTGRRNTSILEVLYGKACGVG